MMVAGVILHIIGARAFWILSDFRELTFCGPCFLIEIIVVLKRFWLCSKERKKYDLLAGIG